MALAKVKEVLNHGQNKNGERSLGNPLQRLREVLPSAAMKSPQEYAATTRAKEKSNKTRKAVRKTTKELSEENKRYSESVVMAIKKKNLSKPDWTSGI